MLRQNTLRFGIALKRKRAEAALLAPLGLTIDSFRQEQQDLKDGIAEQLTRDLIHYELPHVSALVVGIDTLGPHIYVVDDNEIHCNDLVGFAAIGIGARHAESQFMLGRHSWQSPEVDTALLTYIAKKRSEVAPGVGEGTDMFTIGPQLGSYSPFTREMVESFDRIYQNLKISESRMEEDARKEANNYVREAAKRAAEATGSQESSAGEGISSGDKDKGEPIQSR